MKRIRNFILDEKGQALSEYGLVIGIVVIAAIAVLTTMKDKIVALFTDINNSLHN